MSPYSFSLVCVLLSLMGLCNALMFSFWYKKALGLSLAEAVLLGEAFAFFFVLALSLILVAIFLYNGYEYWGTIEIYNDRIAFRAPLQKQIVFLHSDLKDIGIDYGTISGVKQFWIYFSKEKICGQYAHNILRLPYSKSTMRVQYRNDLYNALLKSFSCIDLRKKLSRSYSVVLFFQSKTNK